MELEPSWPACVVRDPVQAYCDMLHYRYLKSTDAGYDIGTEIAFERWLADARPG